MTVHVISEANDSRHVLALTRTAESVPQSLRCSLILRCSTVTKAQTEGLQSGSLDNGSEQ